MAKTKQKKLSLSDLEEIAVDVRTDIIKMLEAAGSGHPGGSLGMADVFTALYFDILHHDPKNPDWKDRDLLIMSGGHIVPVRYAAMARAGYFDRKELLTLRKFGSRLQGHPERQAMPGLETTSGPLGEGLGQAAGMALALKKQGEIHRWVYCTMGDGELNEGICWESAMFASKYKLSNLTVIVDRNNIQIDGLTEDVMPLEPLKDKWEAFGWHVIEIDGNNIEDVIDACAMARAIVEKPVCILAHTIPGKGVEFMEYLAKWHGNAPNQEEAKQALHDLRTLKGKIRGDHE